MDTELKKGLIIVNAYTDVVAATTQAERLCEELQRLGSEVKIVKNNRYDAYLAEDGRTVTSFSGADYVVFFDKDKYLPRILESVGIKVFNCAHAIEVCDDKMATHLALSGSGIKMPVTMSAPLCYTPDAQIAPSEADKAISVFGLPIIVKECFGSRGRGVYLAESRAELLDLMNKLKFHPYIFQQYVSSSRGRDVRLIVIGGKVYASMLRKSDSDFRSNIDLGGKGYPCEPSAEFEKMAETAAKYLNLDYCGVDILFGENDEPILCEVNSNAYFTEMERITGKNVAGEFAAHILKTLK